MRILPISTLASMFALACSGGATTPSRDAVTPFDAATVDGAQNVPDAAPLGDDPADNGAFAVTTQTVSIPGAGGGRTLPSTVYQPTGATNPPLVVVSPGFQMARTQYVSYAQHLASWGFVVVLTDYGDTSFFPSHQVLADDLRAAITWALDQPGLSIDPTRIGAAGHSLGGKVSLLAAANDARIRAVVGWDPVDSSSPSVAPERMDDVEAAVAVIGETTNGSGGFMPCAPTAENFQQFYAAAAAPALAMTMVGADHMDWVDDPGCSLCGLCDEGSLGPAVTRTATKRLNAAWFRTHLQGEGGLDSWLTSPPEVALDQATVSRK